jgi:hypothetical protein
MHLPVGKWYGYLQRLLVAQGHPREDPWRKHHTVHLTVSPMQSITIQF